MHIELGGTAYAVIQYGNLAVVAQLLFVSATASFFLFSFFRFDVLV
jgi:hypothetical protein